MMRMTRLFALVALVLLVAVAASADTQAPESVCVPQLVPKPTLVGKTQILRDISFELYPDMVVWDFTNPITGWASDAQIINFEYAATGEQVLEHGNGIDASGWTYQSLDRFRCVADELWIGVKHLVFPGADAPPMGDTSYGSIWRDDGVSLCPVWEITNDDAPAGEWHWTEMWYHVTLVPGQEWPDNMGFMFNTNISYGSTFLYDDILVLCSESHVIFIGSVFNNYGGE